MKKPELLSRLNDLLTKNLAEPTLNNLLALIQNISTVEACRGDLCEVGIIKNLIPLMSSKSTQVKSKAVSILSTLALEDKGGLVIRKEQGIEKLRESLQDSTIQVIVTQSQRSSIDHLWRLSLKSLQEEEKSNETLEKHDEEVDDVHETYEGSWKELIDGMINEEIKGDSIVKTDLPIPKPKRFFDESTDRKQSLDDSKTFVVNQMQSDGATRIMTLTTKDHDTTIPPKQRNRKASVSSSIVENNIALKLNIGPEGIKDEMKKNVISENLELKLSKGPNGQDSGKTKPIGVPDKAGKILAYSMPEKKSSPGPGFFSKLFQSKLDSGSMSPQVNTPIGISVSSFDPDPVEFNYESKPKLKLDTSKIQTKGGADSIEPLMFPPTEIALSPSPSPRGSDEYEQLEQTAIERRRKQRLNKIPARGRLDSPVVSPRDVTSVCTPIAPIDETLLEKKEHKREEAEGKDFTKSSAYLETVKKIQEGLTKNLQQGVKSTLDLRYFEYKYNDDFTTYHGQAFHDMRTRSLILDSEYLASICSGPMKVVITPGKSGALLFFTQDGKYILKTLTNGEQKLLYQIMPEYSQYISQNPDSLLVRFTGMYSCVYEKRTFHIVVMNNVFETNKMTETFDLKGSTVGRSAKEGEKVMKDLDIINLKRTLNITERQKIQFLKQVTKDSDFLARFKIMDYSMLLGIKRFKKGEKLVWDTKGKSQFQCLMSEDESEAYFIAIIDVLQLWNLKKKAELQIKSLSSDKYGLSSVPPPEYSVRFQNFVKNLVI